MTVTLNLPLDIEKAFLGEAASRGMTLDEYVSEVLLARVSGQHGMSVSGETARLEIEDGVPVLHTGHPLALRVIDDTLELVRQERDLGTYGTF